MTSLYGNIGGTRKSISSAYANIGGSRKQIFPYNAETIYTYAWYIYYTTTSTATEQGQTLVIPESYLGRYYAVLYDSLPSYNASKFILDNSYTGFQNLHQNGTIGASGGSYFAFASSSETDSLMAGGNVYVNTVYYISGRGYIDPETLQLSLYVTKYTITLAKGSFFSTVTSTYRYQYPDDGASGSYWYVYIGEV